MSDKAQAFDRAFSGDDDTLALLKRILTAFDLDIYQEGNPVAGTVYTVRLWEEGETIVECHGTDLEDVLKDADRNAAAIANYG